MTEYYYTENPNVEHAEISWDVELKKNIFKFISDNGVFSKHGVDFGTKTLLDAMILQENEPEKVLDVGCGYGPIGITLAKVYFNAKIDMTDVNERAMALAQRNAISNGVETQVNIFKSNAYENVADQDYTTIVSNPPVRAGKKVVDQIISGAYDHLTANGQLLIVLQKKQGAPSAKKLMQATFNNVEIIKKNKGYYILRSVK